MDFLEIFIAAIASFALGACWYTFLFGKAWQAETGITDEQAQQGLAITHGLAFVMMLVIAFGISYVVHAHAVEDQTFGHGAFHGALFAILIALPSTAINYLYQKKSLKLYLIDAGYLLTFFALQGGGLAALKLFTEMPG